MSTRSSKTNWSSNWNLGWVEDDRAHVENNFVKRFVNHLRTSRRKCPSFTPVPDFTSVGGRRFHILVPPGLIFHGKVQRGADIVGESICCQPSK
jgi:hypothetical protein